MQILFTAFLLLVSSLICSIAAANDPIGDPANFANGEIADADDINENFKTVFDAVRALQTDPDASILVGQVPPADETGEIGDIYFDTNALLLWGPKDSDGWLSSISIQGAPGARGPKGDKGDNGIDGEDGADGTNGASCTIAQENGGALISCGSGTSAALYDGANGSDGEDGKDGADGNSCSVTQETGGASIFCTNGSNASLVNGINGTNGTNGTNGVDGIDGQDGRSCTSSQGDGVVTISCDDGTSGEVASGRCTATQSGSNVVIDCADGSGGILASEGTVVTFLDGQLGEIDYTFNTGDIVVKDGNDIILGRLDDQTSSTPSFIVVLSEDPPLTMLLSPRAESESITFGDNAMGNIYFDDGACSGAPFVADNIRTARVKSLYVNGELKGFFAHTGQRYEKKVVNSRWVNQQCEEINRVLSFAYLLQSYEPAEEILSATYPLRFEQLP